MAFWLTLVENEVVVEKYRVWHAVSLWIAGQAIKLDKNYEPAQQNMRRLFGVDHFGSSKEPVNLGDK